MADSFLTQLYSQKIPSGLSPAEAQRARLDAFAKQKGWFFHTGASSGQEALYRRLLPHKAESPVERLVGVARQGSIKHVIAPTGPLTTRFQTKYARHVGRPLRHEVASGLAAVVQTHEMAEMFYGGGKARRSFGSHVDPRVLTAEMRAAEFLGPEVHREQINIRNIERQAIEKRTGKPTFYTTKLGDIIDQESKYLSQNKVDQYTRKVTSLREPGVFHFPETYGEPPKGFNRAIADLDVSWRYSLLNQPSKKSVQKVASRGARFTKKISSSELELLLEQC